MSWIYQGKEFTIQDIPDGAVGFIYIMAAIIDEKLALYVGKKNFFANVKRPLSKKALAMVTDKRLKKYRHELKPDFMNYYSSNKTLKEFAKSGGVVKREILRICNSKTELTYQETKYQFMYEVLEKDEYLNSNILGRFYKTK
jgi:ribosomal protein L14E/L6E/L27E